MEKEELSPKEIVSRQEILEGLGLVQAGRRSSDLVYTMPGCEHKVDFSAIDPKKYAMYALLEFTKAFAIESYEKAQADMRKALGLS